MSNYGATADEIDRAMDRSIGSVGRVLVRTLMESEPHTYREHSKEIAMHLEIALASCDRLSEDVCTYAVLQLLVARLATSKVTDPTLAASTLEVWEPEK